MVPSAGAPAPVTSALADKCAVPLGWFGASGLGRKRVAKPAISKVRQGCQSSSSCWQFNRDSVLVKVWAFTVRGRPPKAGSLLTCYSEVQVHSPDHRRWFLSRCIGQSLCPKETEQAVILVAKDLGLSPTGATQLTMPSNTFRPSASTGRPCQGAVYGRRYWPGIREFLAGGVQRPLHRDWLQARSLW